MCISVSFNLMDTNWPRLIISRKIFLQIFFLTSRYLQGRDATPYLERNRVGRDAIDAASALTDMGKYLFLERRLPVYDIAVAITKLDMCRYDINPV